MLDGSMVALITPLKNDRVDERALRRLVELQEENGTDVLVPCGTTGESATLSYEEHEQVVEIVADEADEAAVMAGSGSNSTHEALRLTTHAEDVGCDAGLVITPYYNKPPQRGMISHFKKIANQVKIDIVLYNVPSRTGTNLTAESVIELSEVENIIGVKEASGNMDQVSEICRGTSDDFAVLSGDDSLTLPILSVGGDGVVSVLANILPGRVNDLVTAWQKGNPVEARNQHHELLPLMQAMFLDTNPIPVKEAANMLGLCETEVRSPLAGLEEKNRTILSKRLKQAGLTVND